MQSDDEAVGLKRAVKAWPLSLPFNFHIKWVERAQGGRTHLTVRLVFECNDERAEIVAVDEEVDDNQLFNYVIMINELGDVYHKRLPTWLVESAKTRIQTAACEAVRNNPDVPPRNQSDWSFKKLHNAVDRALDAVPGHQPLTLENVAQIINRRYKLQSPLSKDALRMLLKRHNVKWKELKQYRMEERTLMK